MWSEKLTDAYARRWQATIARPGGKIPGSRLRPQSPGLTADTTGMAVTYEMQVPRGTRTTAAAALTGAMSTIADVLELDQSQLRIAELPPGTRRSRRKRRALLTIVEAGVWRPDAPTDDGPQVQDGLIAGLCRDQDGRRQLPIRMWDRTGMIATVLLGRDKSACTSAGWQLAAAALASGQVNLLLVDPKGQSPAALRQAAHVVVTGQRYAEQAAPIVRALIRGRQDYAAAKGLDQLTPGLPGSELPTWMVLHTDVERVHSWDRTWRENLLTFGPLGIWPVATAPSSAYRPWGDLITQGAFRQTIRVPDAFVAEQPRVLDVADLTEQLQRFARPPELATVDVESLTEVLDQPVDGRWVVDVTRTHTAHSTSRSERWPIDDDFQHHLEGAASGGTTSPRLLTMLNGARTPLVWAPDPENELIEAPDRKPAAPNADDDSPAAIAAIRSELVNRILIPFALEGWLDATDPGSWRLPNVDDASHDTVARARSTVISRIFTLSVESGWLEQTGPRSWRLPAGDNNR